MSGPLSPRLRITLPAVGLAVCALVAAWLALGGLRPKSALLRRWQAEVETLQGDALQTRLQQVAELGDAGLPVLAGALHSRREETADAALATLEAELSRWRTLDARASSRKVALLAQELSQRASQRKGEGPGNRAAAEIVARILVWPVDGTAIDNATLIANCETVLLAAANRPPAGSLVASPPGLSERQGKKSPQRNAARYSVKAPTGNFRDEEAFRGELDAGLPVVQVPSGRVRLQPEIDEFQEANAEEAKLAGKSIAPAALAPQPAKRLVPSKALRDLVDLEIMRLLHSRESAEATAAEQELMRRGYTALRLRVARRLTDPDPRVRRELAELLPQMSGLDARPWLLWLSRDADPDVQRAAAAIIATSTDPQLLARLREMRATQ